VLTRKPVEAAEDEVKRTTRPQRTPAGGGTTALAAMKTRNRHRYRNRVRLPVILFFVIVGA